MADDRHLIESPYAWLRLAMSLLLMTIGGSGMYSLSVVLPRMQQDFGIDRGNASLAYTLTMVGFGLGGILMGRLMDRFGIMRVVMLGAVGLGAGYIVAGLAPSLPVFYLAQGLLIGLLGTSATSRRWWPTPRAGSTGAAALRWRSA